MSDKALVLLQDRDVANAAPVQKLQQMALDQIRVIAGTQRDNALRAILLGLTLWRVKQNLAHGEFGKWISSKVTQGNIWTPNTAKKNASFYMRLALVFVEKSNAGKAELLALPGDQKDLTLASYEGAARKLMEKAAKFVGENSLNDLLDEYGIKDTKKALKRSDDGEDDAGAADAASAVTVQDLFNGIDSSLRSARAAAADKAVWMSLTKQQHDDLLSAARETERTFTELYAKTHGRTKK